MLGEGELAMIVNGLVYMVPVIALIVSILTFHKSSKEKSESSASEQASRDATISTKLDFIAEDVKDVKAEQRAIQRNVNDVRDIAVKAKESADAAHRRLDRAGIDGKRGSENGENDR